MRTVLFFLVFIVNSSYVSEIKFDKYFQDQTMRVDFKFYGDAENEKITLEEVTKEPFWGGSKNQLVGSLNYGEYKFEVIDSESGKIIYSQGFSTLFEEWQTTLEADTVSREFMQTITFPEPKDKVILKIYSRSWKGSFEEIFSYTVHPENYQVAEVQNYPSVKILDNGNPAEKVDLAFLAEGYTKDEMDKFISDSKRMIDYLFEYEPFKSNRGKFNIWLVKSDSEDSGTDIPGKNIYKSTVLNSNFYTFGSERYLTTADFFAVKNVASSVPYDDICILVNSKKYGGGGIYNHYCITSVDHALSEEVFIHELAHSFGGLGDEYYSSSTAYNDFFNLEIEPWQPNLTTLVNFDAKWKSMIHDTVPVPTPRERHFENIIGVYEGGGYVNKGMYSPMMDCRMNTNEAEGFCPVCQASVLKMIREKTR